MRSSFDVIVVGAGPAGAAAALALARDGFQVAMLEARAARQVSPGESLSAAAQFALRELGLWEEFQTLSHRPTYLTRSLWRGDTHDADTLRYGLGPNFHVERAF